MADQMLLKVCLETVTRNIDELLILKDHLKNLLVEDDHQSVVGSNIESSIPVIEMEFNCKSPSPSHSSSSYSSSDSDDADSLDKKPKRKSPMKRRNSKSSSVKSPFKSPSKTSLKENSQSPVPSLLHDDHDKEEDKELLNFSFASPLSSRACSQSPPPSPKKKESPRLFDDEDFDEEDHVKSKIGFYETDNDEVIHHPSKK